MKSNLRGLLVAFALTALGFAALPSAASAQDQQQVQQCGTVCPNSGIVVSSTAVFGGQMLGGFGIVGANGALTAGQGVTGSVTGTKTGGGDNNIAIIYDGPGCSIDCGSATVEADVSAFERGSMVVTMNATTPGTMFAIANSGQLVAGAGLTIGYNPGTQD